MAKHPQLHRAVRYILFSWLLLAIALGSAYVLFTRPKQIAFVMEERDRLQNLQNQIADEQNNVIEDLFLLASMREPPSILQNADCVAENAMTYMALLLMQSRSYYDQIRLLDTDGRERIRIDYAGGNPHQIAEENLSDESDRYHYRYAKAIQPGQIFLSPLELSIEQGAIEKPLKPIIRYVIGVYGDKQDTPIGFIVINYLANHMFRILDRENAGNHGTFLMANEEGYYLHGPDPQSLWGWQLPDRSDENLSVREPELWSRLAEQESGELQSRNRSLFYLTYHPTGFAMQDIDIREGKGAETFIVSMPHSRKWFLIFEVNDIRWRNQTADIRHMLMAIGLLGALVIPMLALHLVKIKETNRKLHEQLLEDATHDTLTKVFTRKAGFALLGSMIGKAESPSVLCFIDLNNLKKVNDTLGHEMGDAFIVETATALKKVLRNSDILIRLGGDEFLIFLPLCSIRIANERMEKANDIVGKACGGKGCPLPWSFSYGCIETNAMENGDIETLVAKADSVMYRYKQEYKQQHPDGNP